MKAAKAFNSDTNGFDETVDYSVLMCANVEGNNNKFYCIELQKNSADEHRVFTHYGRLGSGSVYDIRSGYCGYSDAKKEYDSLLKKKLRGKKKDGYIEKYEVVDTFAPTVGSPNICKSEGNKSATVKVKNDLSAIKKEYKDKEVGRVIDQVINENIHNITSTMDVTLTSNGFETPLGPVTLQHIEKSKEPLLELKDIIDKNTVQQKYSTVKKLNTAFFSLIPHKFGRRISESDLVLDSNTLLSKFDLLEMLESAVQMGDTLTKGSEEKYKALGADIVHVTDFKTIDDIKKFVYSTKAPNHKNLNVWRIKIVNVFEIKIPTERDKFQIVGKKMGNIKELFHGSKNCNILSILKNGLKIFPSHPTKAGDMFGVGLYFADNSTKSANYSTGFWSSVNNKYDNNFLLVADVAMGKVKEEYSATMRQAPSGWDSTKGCKGSSLYNNEYIVYKEEQTTLKYLLEFICLS